MADRSFLSWPFFEARHRELADNMQSWCAENLPEHGGDLDAQYLTSSYRVYLNEADAKRVFAYIKHLQNTSPMWNAVTYNCTAFIGDIARYMGLKTPYTHLLYPEEWVNNLREINGERKTVQLAPDHVQ